MSRVIELVPAGQPLPQVNHPDIPSTPTADKLNIKYGYFIGVREDGSIVFKKHGTLVGLVEILGLAELAKRHIDKWYKYKQKEDDGE